eukprot:211128-Chlamydomonas_euryale.AAC.6
MPPSGFSRRRHALNVRRRPATNLTLSPVRRLLHTSRAQHLAPRQHMCSRPASQLLLEVGKKGLVLCSESAGAHEALGHSPPAQPLGWTMLPGLPCRAGLPQLQQRRPQLPLQPRPPHLPGGSGPPHCAPPHCAREMIQRLHAAAKAAPTRQAWQLAAALERRHLATARRLPRWRPPVSPVCAAHQRRPRHAQLRCCLHARVAAMSCQPRSAVRLCAM